MELSAGNSLPTGGGGGIRVLRLGGKLLCVVEGGVVEGGVVEGGWEAGRKGGGLADPCDDPDDPSGEGDPEVVGGKAGVAGSGAGGKDGTGITFGPDGGSGMVEPGKVASGGIAPGVRESLGGNIGAGAEGRRPTPIT